jgi:hypothetical protein
VIVDAVATGDAEDLKRSLVALGMPQAATGEPVVKVGAFMVPPGSIVSSTPTLLRFRVPLGAVTEKIGVTTAGGAALSATNLTAVQPRRATAFAPAAGLARDLAKITGTSITNAVGTGGERGDLQGAAEAGGTDPVVKVGTVAATVVVSSPDHGDVHGPGSGGHGHDQHHGRR